ncbi:MAG: hypothetical protein HXY20_02535 [Acidobacteria bacterium]|nr:hypothetical protein [Acidobacteriota bacterium]
MEIVLHPSWWHTHGGIDFDEDFFYHPARRVESERRMEAVLHERFGAYGLGADRDRDLPVIGAVHNAAGYLVSEMFGCEIRYRADAPPDVVPAGLERLEVDPEAPFRSAAFKRFERLRDALKARHGYLLGDIGWAGVLNLALDLRGQELFLDMADAPDRVVSEFRKLAWVIERFVAIVESETGSSSVSVNRTVRHLRRPVYLHSECSNTMISAAAYERFLLPVDAAWSQRHRPFGIHHCGRDPHRLAASYAKVPHLDFLDVGWGGDVARIRECLPRTFLNIRLDPVGITRHTPDEIRATIVRLVRQSANPWLTGVCCINMDSTVADVQIAAIFETVAELRRELAGARDG